MKSHKGIKDQLSFDKTALEDDKKLYELLFQQLEQEKEISIRPQFSARVAQRLLAKRKRENRHENLLFGIAIVSVLVFSFFTIKVISSLETSVSLLSFKMLLPALTLTALIVTFQLIDNNLLKRKRIKRHLGI